MPDNLDRLKTALADRYAIEEELGAGGMATVYLAEDVKHRRKVAVKVLRPELAATLGPERFLREIEIAANLQHPHILPLYDSGQAESFLYYVMPYVNGESLRDKLHREGELPVAEAVRILREVVDALDHAHGEGIVHRDIKPDNVMLSGRHALVTDFGVAKAVSEATGRQQLTTAGIVLGTPAYMAPEQAAASQHIDQRADIYAVGAMAYEMLTARPPFVGATPQVVLAAHVTQTPDPVTKYRAHVPEALSQIVARCLEKKPADRWQSAADLLPQLEPFTTPSGGITPTGMQPTAVVAGRRRRRVVGAVAAVVVLAVVTFGVWALMRGTAGPNVGLAETQSIAVLPFDNVGGNPEDEHFADGMTLELIAGLGKVERLRVVGRGSVFQFKGQSVDAREVGRQLNVATVLEGSVRRSGNLLRLSASLVNARDGLQMWVATYEREDGDAFALQDELTAAILSELELRLGGVALAASRAGRTSDRVAQDLYMRGRYHLILGGGEADFRRSIDLFQQAIARDPDFALAYSGLAMGWGALAEAYIPPVEGYSRARDASLAALEIDSLVAEAHAMLGHLEAPLNYDFAAAEQRMRYAIALDPSSAWSRLLLTIALCWKGAAIDEGLEQIQRALELDPLNDLMLWVKQGCLYFDRRYDELIATHEESSPHDFFYFESWVGAAYREKGMNVEALREYRRAQELAGDDPVYGLGITYARMGRLDEARDVLRNLVRKAEQQWVDPSVLATLYAAVGETETAVAILEAIESPGSGWFLLWLQIVPEASVLAEDPRVQRVLRNLGVPEIRIQRR